MSEEKTVYVTGSTTTYKTANDMYEEFLKRTGIDPVKIESWGDTCEPEKSRSG